GVVAVAADQEVVAVAAGDAVVPRIAVHDVGFSAAGQRIVAAEALDEGCTLGSEYVVLGRAVQDVAHGASPFKIPGKRRGDGGEQRRWLWGVKPPIRCVTF